MSQFWRLVGPNDKPYASAVQGILGRHRRNSIYGRLDCSAVLCAIAPDGDVNHCAFFHTKERAQAAGYRPCAVCLPMAYAS